MLDVFVSDGVSEGGNLICAGRQWVLPLEVGTPSSVAWSVNDKLVIHSTSE